MGFFSSILQAAAPIAGTFLGGPVGGAIGGALGGLLGSHDAPSSTTTTSQNTLDPAIRNMLFGAGGNSGLLSQYQGMLNTPQSDAAKAYASSSGDYLKQYGSQDIGAIRNSATGLMQGNSAPMAQAAQSQAAPMAQAAQTPAALMGAATASLPAYAVGNSVKAPAQNDINLTGTFQSMLNGGNNAALKDSLKYGTDLTNAQFAKNQTDVTNNLTRNVLPSIGGGAIAAGQFGGSRQGIAEGNALSDYTNQLTNANTQLGLANSANTTGQLANDYQQGQGRALAAAQGLSQQQYTTALQDANTKNSAEFMNVGNSFDASKTNANLAQQAGLANLGTTAQANLANAGYAQQTNLANQASQQQTNLANTGYAQQTNLANQASQLQTNAQNNASTAAGSGVLGGLLGQASGAVNASDNYALSHAQGVNNLLTPYLSATGGQTNTQPLYNSTAGNVAGGLLAGSQLGGLFGAGSTDAATARNSNGGGMFGLGGMFGSTPGSMTNMQGSTSQSIYGPSSGGSVNWGSMSSLFS